MKKAFLYVAMASIICCAYACNKKFESNKEVETEEKENNAAIRANDM